MNSTIPITHVTEAIATLLDEAFNHGRGYFLDPHASIFETLASVTAAQASVPLAGVGATIAAQVKHIAFDLGYVAQCLCHPATPPADWGEVWRTVGRVSHSEWQAIQQELRTNYHHLNTLFAEPSMWTTPHNLSLAIALIAHAAYHLGEIRQALWLHQTHPNLTAP